MKNRAVELAAHDYVLSLDADEALDPVLADAILKAKENFTGQGLPDEPVHKLLR